jgi:hypothetical protein
MNPSSFPDNIRENNVTGIGEKNKKYRTRNKKSGRIERIDRLGIQARKHRLSNKLWR